MPEYISGIERACAMRWFQKNQVPEVWEVAGDQPLGDIGAAQRIREICASAGSIAEKMASVGGRNAEKQKAIETERYQAALKRALELAKTSSFDLIFSDVVMPVMDGLTLLEQMRAADVITPVVMMSGQAHIEMFRHFALNLLDRDRTPRFLLQNVLEQMLDHFAGKLFPAQRRE